MSSPLHERTSGDAPAIEQSAVERSERHELLAARRRRRALDVIAATTGAVTLEALAAEISAREAGRDGVDEETVERVAIDLYHAHVPKLADFGVVSYDETTRWIEPDGTAIDALRNPAENG